MLTSKRPIPLLQVEAAAAAAAAVAVFAAVVTAVVAAVAVVAAASRFLLLLLYPSRSGQLSSLPRSYYLLVLCSLLFISYGELNDQVNIITFPFWIHTMPIS